MKDYVIENEQLKVTVRSSGCEIVSVIKKSDGREFMWDGNPDAWCRHSPILFPHIGVYRDDKMTYEGKVYHSKQHGPVRNMEWTLVSHSDTEIFMTVNQTEDTLKEYPFDFKLTAGYKLDGNDIKVMWKVENTNEKEMFFSIGGHPAFACPPGKNSMDGCEIRFETDADAIHYSLLNNVGQLVDGDNQLKLNDKKFTIDKKMFDTSAYVIENNQTHQVSILNEGKPFVTVKFEAPVFGLWSPAKKDMPFMCIEPWYGRADRHDFVGELKDREWENQLAPGKTFEKAYHIIFEG